MMKQKKSIIFIIIIIILIIVVGLLYLYNQNKSEKKVDTNTLGEEVIDVDYTITFEKYPLTDLLGSIVNDSDSITINHYIDGVLQVEIHDTMTESDLLQTKALFTYDTKNHDFKIYNYPHNKRIFHHYIADDYIYAVIIDYNTESINNTGIKWDLVRYDKNFNNSIIIKTGYLDNPFSAPVLLYSSNMDKILLVAYDQNNVVKNGKIVTEERLFNIYEVIDDKLISLVSGYGNNVNKTGVMLCNLFDLQVYEDEILYCTTDFSSIQEIKSYNLKTSKERVLYTNYFDDSLKGYYINSFQTGDKGLYIGFVKQGEYTKGKTAYINYKNNKYQEVESKALYGRTPFVLDNMLFHYSSWQMYIPSQNKFVLPKIEWIGKQEKLSSYFLVLNNDTILALDYRYGFYLGKITADIK